ncbi:cyclic peptide export ABC transporter [Hymenobacter rubripertinctus]|uniref:Cyclic peptide export ABC transporter n=1 Tax=Hymenobacter rubripertinctus TaxID=2029981 RepID=A0A418QK13_9BACT|nr:cyclic peptide export ABC transporter [Hymenobacter rubripertinctus]RIY05505.1 cyclic peptide export ABC transporter [Hymenobacter rubripertinctus]
MKQLWKIILLQVGKWGLLKNVSLGLLSGLCSFLFINLVTRVVSLLTANELKTISKEYILAFAFTILVYIWVRRSLALAIIHLSQSLFWKLRKQVLSLVLQANYQQMSGLKVRISSVLVNDVNVLTNTSLSLIEFVTASIVSTACLIYLISLSPALFLITLGIALLGVTVYLVGSGKNNLYFEQSRSLEDSFIDELNSVLHGFKEIYMEPKKGKYIFDHKINTIARTAFSNNTAAFTGFLNNQITGQVLFYILISSVLLFFSIQLGIKPAATVNYVFILLYLLGSIETIMVLLPNIVRAKVSSGRLMDLKKELEEANFSNPVSETYMSKEEFCGISVNELEFNYAGASSPFSIGPINFSIVKGETVFIYGGNGSGKTTFIHSVLGLCKPSSGEIKLNDVNIDDNNYPFYRTVFSVVFNDFYLFDEILVADHFDLDKWNYFLYLFEMEEIVQIDGLRFSTTALSTGQRKRLALIVALLEEKPVLVIDEWAADQDPYFRKKFYTEIIPILKKQGVTIIAITHDDRYYRCADKLYKMEYGILSEEDVNVSEEKFIS